MCLAIPMKIIEINGEEGLVELEGVRRAVDLTLLEDAKLGNYVLIHAGFAIELLQEKEALETIALFDDIASKL